MVTLSGVKAFMAEAVDKMRLHAQEPAKNGMRDTFGKLTPLEVALTTLL